MEIPKESSGSSFNSFELTLPENFLDDKADVPNLLEIAELKEAQATKIEVFRQSMFEAYDNSELPEVVAKLKKEIAQGDPFKHPDYVNKGSFSIVFAVRDSKGEEFAVRLENPYPPAGNIVDFNVDDYLERFTFGQGNPTLEQPKAASIEDQTIISPFIPGSPINRLSESQLRSLTAEQFTEFTDGICKAANDRIWFDAHGGNFLYDANDGFKAIDYGFFDTHVDYSPNSTAADTLQSVVSDIMTSSGDFRAFSGRKKDALLDTLHSGIDSSKLLANKHQIHDKIEKYRAESTGKHVINLLWE